MCNRYFVAGISKLGAILEQQTTTKMRNRINEDVLCVLIYKEDELIIAYERITEHFSTEKEVIRKLCETNFDNINNITKYLKTTESIKQLQKHFKYCKKLDGSYQGFSVNIEERVKQINDNRNLFYINSINNPNYDFTENILSLQNELNNDFILWFSAYNIEKAYRKCFDNKSILTFSHRINGWSNPEYKLSENFSVELKTNFGYGGSSYFYIKLKYKNIEITPFSEWIDYEIAQFSEIVKYTKSFSYRLFRGIYDGKRVYRQIIENSNWQDAIDFTKIACNISLKDEEEFVRKYIIEECEKMVVGLENIYSVSDFTFKGENDIHYQIDKTGHQLMEFRGEKISGAIDFIAKILEFDGIAEIKSFINRIEECNKKIQPLLIQELKSIKFKLDSLNSEMTILKPRYLIFVERNQNYIRLKEELRLKLIASGELFIQNFDFVKFNKIFLEKFPEFEKFENDFIEISKQYKVLSEKIQNFIKLFENITTYNAKISAHFKNKNST